MSYINIDERINETERAMRQEDPELVATFERLGVFEPAADADRRLLLMASAVVFTVAIATMSPVAWVLSAFAAYAWIRS